MSKSFRRPVSLFVLVAALAVSSARSDEAPQIVTLKTGVLQVCLYWGFAPFASAPSQNSPTKDWQGWDVDFLNKFATDHRLQLMVVPKDFNDIWLQPGQGNCDIAGTGISDTEDRRNATGKAGAWSDTYYHVLRAFVVRTADSTSVNTIEDLRGTKAIVTEGSTAHSDLCYRMQQRGIHSCYPSGDSDKFPCSKFPGLEDFPEVPRETDPYCIYIDYPRNKQEKCAAADVAASKNKYSDPFAYGGGYGSVQKLACDSSPDACSDPPKAIPLQVLATVWPHCNMASNGVGYAEPFSFVVRSKDTGLLEALNCYISKNEYEGTPIPVLSPPCPTPYWTPEQKKCSQ